MQSRSQKNITIIAVITALVLIGGGWLAFKSVITPGISVQNTNSNFFNTSTSTEDSSLSNDPMIAAQQGVFTSPTYGFSVKPLSDETMSHFTQGNDGDVYAINKKDVGIVAQIFVTTYDEAPSTFTKNKIISETGVKGTDWSAIKIAGINAISFTNNSNNPATREIWFVHDGNLFQITGYKNSAETLNNFSKTFSFNN